MGQVKGERRKQFKISTQELHPTLPDWQKKRSTGITTRGPQLVHVGSYLQKHTHTHNINTFAIVQHRSPSMVPVMVVSFLVCVTIILTPIATTASGIGIHSV